ncbi:hypothetical protein Tco_0272595 [Tanacetum coccineum]
MAPVKVRVDQVTHPYSTEDIPVALLRRELEELERANMRLRDMMDVASQRVARSQRRELRVQRKMIQIRHFRFNDHMRIARLEACARRHLNLGLTFLRIFYEENYPSV